MRRSEENAKESCSNFAMKKAFRSYYKCDFDIAIKFCSIAIKNNPQNGSAYNLRGEMYTKKYYFKWAIRDLNKALSL